MSETRTLTDKQIYQCKYERNCICPNERKYKRTRLCPDERTYTCLFERNYMVRISESQMSVRADLHCSFERIYFVISSESAL
ncbi:hypothetical protein HanPI659440_Chr01g0026441 [Helianthus annuus]|nr:hypothetical protein HanPI659440_Chr01g0026441 [Helianthus annuus]